MSATEQKQETKVVVRWMCRCDMEEVLAIESESFEFPWPENDFMYYLNHRNCIGVVAEHDARVAGFMIYKLDRTRISVLNFAVTPGYRRRGVGSFMISRLQNNLSPQHRRRIVIEVRETNLGAQLFFRALGFRAVNVFRNHYQDTREDAYLMQFRL